MEVDLNGILYSGRERLFICLMRPMNELLLLVLLNHASIYLDIVVGEVEGNLRSETRGNIIIIKGNALTSDIY